MIIVCGEALMDVFAQGDTPMGVSLDARVGGSPFNVAIGLARLGQRSALLAALSRGFLGERLRRTLAEEGVDLSLAVTVDAPTTLALVGLDAAGSPSYAFYGEGGADRQLLPAHLPALNETVAALHFGSYSMVVEPVASSQRRLVEQACATHVISYDPNLRLNVEPELARWVETVQWMAQRAQLIKVSAEDLEALRPGVPFEAVARDWLEQGASLVVVTAGARGAHAFTREHAVVVPALAVQVVDTVGAGDTFQAALLTWLSEQGLLSIAGLKALTLDQLRAAIVFASSAAAITCSRRGADMPRRAEL
jgi:fructokinase